VAAEVTRRRIPELVFRVGRADDQPSPFFASDL
jgi:hypothetical protein